MPEDQIPSFGEMLPGVTYVDRPGAYAFIENAAGEIALIKTSFGLFLPGGGLDPGEDELTALQRELREEMSFELDRADFLNRAAQYHWSEFYQSYFRKIGAFFKAEGRMPLVESNAPGHALVWMPVENAAVELSQEFQRWAATQY